MISSETLLFRPFINCDLEGRGIPQVSANCEMGILRFSMKYRSRLTKSIVKIAQIGDKKPKKNRDLQM